jgi:uncharacterized repeat protein (TIGR01451 family)
MIRALLANTSHSTTPRWLRLTLALLGTISLCSCRSPAGCTVDGGRCISANGSAAVSAAATAGSSSSVAATQSGNSSAAPAGNAVVLTSAEEPIPTPAPAGRSPSAAGSATASDVGGAPSAADSASASDAGAAPAGVVMPGYCPVPASQVHPIAGPMGPPGMELGVPIPYQPVSAWTPPGIAGPWPRNEYLRDGGDQGQPAGVDRTGQVHGLEMEDAIAHYETIDGQTKVQPTNEVYLYAPRFAAVRRVDNLVEGGQNRQVAAVELPTSAVRYDDLQKTRLNTQNVQANRDIGTTVANIYHSKQGDGAISTAVGPKGFQNAFKAYEDIAIIRTGLMLESEMAFLARGALAAQTWDHKDAVRVILNNQAANAAVSNERVETVYTVSQPPANPKLRVIKVASTQMAQPGEMVAFTIRFDNIGNQTIRNVAILDNLSSRMEYLPATAQSSVEAQFVAQPNEGGSTVLRWQLAKPLEPGKGGVVRFTCRVR